MNISPVEEPAMGGRERVMYKSLSAMKTREHLPSERKTEMSRHLGSSQNVGSVAQRLLSFHAGGDSEARERPKYGKTATGDQRSQPERCRWDDCFLTSSQRLRSEGEVRAKSVEGL